METVRLVDMVAPDRLGQYGLVDDMVRAVGKIEQDVIFFLEKFQLLVANEYPETVRFDPQGSQLEGTRTVSTLSSQYAFDPGVELGQMEGFRKIVVRSLFQSQDLVLDGVAGRDDDDAFPLLLLLEHFQQRQAVPVR